MLNYTEEKQKQEIIKETMTKKISELKSVLFLDDFLNEIEVHLEKCWLVKDNAKSEKQDKYLLIRIKQLNTIRQNLLELKEVVEFLTKEEVFMQRQIIPDLNNVLMNFNACKEQSALNGNSELYRKLTLIDSVPKQFIDEYEMMCNLKK